MHRTSELADLRWAGAVAHVRWLLVADLHVRAITHDGELVRELTLDRTRDYQPRGVTPGPQKR